VDSAVPEIIEMNPDYYKRLNADLGFEFHLFSMEHPEWVSKNIPPGAIVVLQTDDSAFNAWARNIAERNRTLENPPRQIVLVHIREILPPHSRIVRADVELVTATTNPVGN
jgi:Family of unknown function (DUF5647)